MRAARLAERASTSTRCTSRSARASRSPAAWPAGRPMPRPPSSRSTTSGASAWTATSSRSCGRARQRRAVPRHGRHRDGQRPGRAARPGPRPRHLPLGVRAQRGRPVDPGGVRRVRPAARHRRPRAGRQPRADGGPAQRRPARARPGSANDLRTPPSRCAPTSARSSSPGVEYGALGGIVSGSGPTVAFLTEDNEAGIDLAVALTARAVSSATSAAPAGRSTAPTSSTHRID